MQRDFCLYCGLPFSLDKQGKPLSCPCSVHPRTLKTLEEQEQRDLAEFAKARHLSELDLIRYVRTTQGLVTVQRLLYRSHYTAAITESGYKATETAIIQVVYRKHKGTLLLEWPFA